MNQVWGGSLRHAQCQVKSRRRFACQTKWPQDIAGLMNHMARNEQREVAPRYQTQFSQEIEGLDLPNKFTPLMFTIYDGKLDARSHISHVRQMMAL